MKTSDLIAAIHAHDLTITQMEMELKKIKAKRESFELRLLAKLAKMKVESLKIGKITAAIRESSFLSIADKRVFLKYVKKNGAFDLFQNRVSPVAVREREEHGEKVPGLKTFTKKWIQLRKSK